MSDREKWRELDLAESTLLDLAGFYSKFIAEEEQKAIPDLEKIAQWKNERRSMIALKRTLTVDDQAAVAHIDATYGPVLRAFIAKE